MANSFKLEPDHVSLNAPNIKFNRFMTYTRVIPWDWSVHRVLTDAVPSGVRHLVINCHGWPWKESFQAPFLSIGTVIHPGNVSAFESLARIETLSVIWITSCGLCSNPDGVNFCKAMARHSRCFVVNHQYAAPDVYLPTGHVDDLFDSSPHYIDPDGASMSRKDFLSLREDLGFAPV